MEKIVCLESVGELFFFCHFYHFYTTKNKVVKVTARFANKRFEKVWNSGRSGKSGKIILEKSAPIDY